MSSFSIKYPEKRNEIIQSLKWLSEKDIKKCINPNAPHSFWDNLKYPLEVYLEDMEFDKGNIEDFISVVFYDVNECQSIKKIAIYLDRLINELGWQKPDQTYLEWHSWNDLVKAANNALKVLKANNYNYDFLYKDL